MTRKLIIQFEKPRLSSVDLPLILSDNKLSDVMLDTKIHVIHYGSKQFRAKLNEFLDGTYSMVISDVSLRSDIFMFTDKRDYDSFKEIFEGMDISEDASVLI